MLCTAAINTSNTTRTQTGAAEHATVITQQHELESRPLD